MIVPLQPALADSLSGLHCAALAGDFLPSLGRKFLEAFYQGVLRQRTGFGFAVIEEGRPAGFVLGSLDSRALFGRLLASGNACRLGWRALPALRRRPGLVGNIAQTFLYPRKESRAPEKAELIVIALDAQYRKRGYGRKLVEALNQSFARQGVASYKVSVVQARVDANRFYLALGFRKVGEFELYGRTWNLFRYPLRPAG